MTASALVVHSGGMDSTTALYLALTLYDDVAAVSVNYGQRHSTELAHAAAICDAIGVEHAVVDLSGVGRALAGSALTDDVDVPHGHYADETMRATVVPNRNAILSNVVAGMAVAQRRDAIVLGVHAGDHPIYPDCRPEFIEALQLLLDVANEGYHRLLVHAPFVNVDKTAIVRLGAALGVPYERTWSCYEGRNDGVHCGACGTCVERREAFELAGVDDPTSYAAPDSDSVYAEA